MTASVLASMKVHEMLRDTNSNYMLCSKPPAKTNQRNAGDDRWMVLLAEFEKHLNTLTSRTLPIASEKQW